MPSPQYIAALLPFLLVFVLAGPSAFAQPWARHTIDSSSVGADGVRSADANGDGRPDFTTGWEEGGQVRVYLHPGFDRARTTWPRVTVGQVSSPEDAVFADLDRDGSMDVVSSSEGETQTVFVHWAPRSGERYADEAAWSTVALPATQGVSRWMYALPMEVDGQHGTDLIVGSKDPNGMVAWLQSPASPRNPDDWRLHKLQTAGWIMSLEPADMDGDGDTDVVVSDRKGDRRGVYWLENPGPDANRNGAPWTRHSLGAANAEVMFLTVERLNDRGGMLILAAVKPHQIAWFRRDGYETPWTTGTWPFPDEHVGTAKSVAMQRTGDRIRLYVSCEHAEGAASGLFLLASTLHDLGSFSFQNIGGPGGEKFDRIALIDLDGDGDADPVTCEETDNLGVVWYENPER